MLYVYAPEGCQHGTHTNGTAYTRGTYSRVHTVVLYNLYTIHYNFDSLKARRRRDVGHAHRRKNHEQVHRNPVSECRMPTHGRGRARARSGPAALLLFAVFDR